MKKNLNTGKGNISKDTTRRQRKYILRAPSQRIQDLELWELYCSREDCEQPTEHVHRRGVR